MAWYRCLELLAIAICVGSAAAAVTIAMVAVTKAYRSSRSLRTTSVAEQPPDKSKWTDDYKAQVAAHWKEMRDRVGSYAADINLLANPLRRDAIEIVKESSNWARLGVQYAMIGNGGALAALPYLLSQTAPQYKLGLHDAEWSAVWFAIGLISAALCCLATNPHRQRCLDKRRGTLLPGASNDMQQRANYLSLRELRQSSSPVS
jgi:hypothetical protein